MPASSGWWTAENEDTSARASDDLSFAPYQVCDITPADALAPRRETHGAVLADSPSGAPDANEDEPQQGILSALNHSVSPYFGAGIALGGLVQLVGAPTITALCTTSVPGALGCAVAIGLGAGATEAAAQAADGRSLNEVDKHEVGLVSSYTLLSFATGVNWGRSFPLWNPSSHVGRFTTEAGFDILMGTTMYRGVRAIQDPEHARAILTNPEGWLSDLEATALGVGAGFGVAVAGRAITASTRFLHRVSMGLSDAFPTGGKDVHPRDAIKILRQGGVRLEKASLSDIIWYAAGDIQDFLSPFLARRGPVREWVEESPEVMGALAEIAALERTGHAEGWLMGTLRPHVPEDAFSRHTVRDMWVPEMLRVEGHVPLSELGSRSEVVDRVRTLRDARRSVLSDIQEMKEAHEPEVYVKDAQRIVDKLEEYLKLAEKRLENYDDKFDHSF